MSISIWEKFESRELSIATTTGSQTLSYVLYGSDDDGLVYNALRTFTTANHPTHNGYIPTNFKAKPIGPQLWEGEVEYGPIEQQEGEQQHPQLGEFIFSFTTSGAKLKITQTENWQKFARGGVQGGAPDFKGAINYDGKSVEGVEIVVPSLKFSLTRRVPGGFLSFDYIRTVAEATGKTNEDQFLFCQPGECLFHGSDGSIKIGDEQSEKEIKLDFEFSPNEDDIILAKDSADPQATVRLRVPFKSGWDYLWVYYRNEEDVPASVVVPQPYAAYTHQVYKRTSFLPLVQ